MKYVFLLLEDRGSKSRRFIHNAMYTKTMIIGMPHALNGVIVLHETGVEIQVPSLGALLWEVRCVFESFWFHYGVVRDRLGFGFALE